MIPSRTTLVCSRCGHAAQGHGESEENIQLVRCHRCRTEEDFKMATNKANKYLVEKDLTDEIGNMIDRSFRGLKKVKVEKPPFISDQIEIRLSLDGRCGPVTLAYNPLIFLLGSVSGYSAAAIAFTPIETHKLSGIDPQG